MLFTPMIPEARQKCKKRVISGEDCDRIDAETPCRRKFMLISAEHLSINFGSRQLLDDVDFYLNEGDKTGVIGINGTGKSTFLKVLAGKLQPDGGTIARKPNLQVSVLAQNPDMRDELTVLEQVFASMPPEFRQLNEYEAKRMLTQLGLADTDRRIGTLSGGERRRAALCAALIHPADVLVLDEPTNHLDTEMVQWLEDWLKKFRGGLVMVTHDRYFLERVVNHITELSRGKLYHYEANYSRYLELRGQRAQMAEASERKRQSILRVEREWILRGCQARSTKSKERIQRYEELKDQKAPERDSTVQLSAASSRLGKKIITLEHISKGYDGRTIFRDFSYGLLRSDRIGIVGFAGKTKSFCPLTLDHALVNSIIRDFHPRMIQADGTAIGSAIAAAATRLDDRKDTKSKIIFLVTDGASNSGQISPLVAAENAAKLGIKIYTIAVGTEEGTLANGMVVQSEFDEPTLRKIAQLTGGEHFRATNMASFNKAFTSIGKLEKSEAKVQTVRHIEEYFMYFLVTGAALALLGLSLQVLKPTPAP